MSLDFISRRIILLEQWLLRTGIFASGVEFYIDLIGKSSHGAQPQRGTDCVKTGAHLINALLEIPARDIDPLEICVVSVGTFHAGDCVNILAGTASLSGIVRSYNTKTRDSILNRIQTICGGIETIYDCKVSPRIVITYPPLINDKKLAELLSRYYRGKLFSRKIGHVGRRLLILCGNASLSLHVAGDPQEETLRFSRCTVTSSTLTKVSFRLALKRICHH
jgi:hypothetical protein